MEIGRLRDQIREMVVELPPVSHVPGEQNPADLGTRGEVSVGDLGSVLDVADWTQLSSARLRLLAWQPREGRRGSSKYRKKNASRRRMSAFHVEMSANHVSPLKILLQEVGKSSELGKAVSRMVEHALKREKLELATRVVARCLHRRGLWEKRIVPEDTPCQVCWNLRSGSCSGLPPSRPWKR